MPLDDTLEAPAADAAGSADEPVVQCRRLTKMYPSKTAVSTVDLSIRRGEVFGLLGPNGAGKTTTILMLLGLTEPTSGSARVLGLDPARRALEVKRRVGYLPDTVGFYGDMTGRENLRYTARLNSLSDEAAADRLSELLDLVGLADRADDKVKTYSRGMTQRLGIADALVKSPEVLILDEPTITLDPRGAAEVLDLIASLARDHGVTVLLSSHLLTQVQSVCDRIGIFVEGRLVAVGTLDDLARQHGGTVSVEVGIDADDDLTELLTGIRSALEVRRDGDLWIVGSDRDIRAEIADAVQDAGHRLTHLRHRQIGLGEIYDSYFAEAGHATTAD